MGRVKARGLDEVEREDRIHRALAKRTEESTPWAELALEFGVAASTLNDRYNGRKNRREAHQDQQKLPPAVEKALKRWCQDLDDAGFPPRMDLLRGMANALAAKRAEEEDDPSLAHIGKNWITRFLDRHPELSSKYSTQIDRQRVYASNPITLRDYFNKLGRLLRKFNFKPHEIYNFDEKRFILGYSSKAKVICKTARRNPHVAQDGSREMLTVLEAVSAAGMILPSFVIYKGKGHYMGWHRDTDDPDAKFAYSKNGWTDDNLGVYWLKHHFDPFTDKHDGRPRLLVMDGHGSHITWEFCQYALSRNIHLICLPAHATHILQPLDVGLFGPLQHYYGKAADTHMRATRSGIKKGTFWAFFREARRQTYTQKSVQSAFRVVGICPFNPDKVFTKYTNKRHPTLLNPPTTPKTTAYQLLRTPKNRRELRQQTHAALKHAPTSKEEYMAIILRLSHLAETALSQADIARIQTQDLRSTYEGKKAIKADKRVISKARVITGAEVIKLREEKDAIAEKAAEKAAKKKKPGRPKKPIDSSLYSAPTTPKVARKKRVKIVTPESAESSSSDESKYKDIDDFYTPIPYSTRPYNTKTPENPNSTLSKSLSSMSLRTRKL